MNRAGNEGLCKIRRPVTLRWSNLSFCSSGNNICIDNYQAKTSGRFECLIRRLLWLTFQPGHRSARHILKKALDLRIEIPCDSESARISIVTQKTGHPVIGQMHTVRSLIHRIVTGAYEPASGTCLTISFMMSGLPIT